MECIVWINEHHKETLRFHPLLWDFIENYWSERMANDEDGIMHLYAFLHQMTQVNSKELSHIRLVNVWLHESSYFYLWLAGRGVRMREITRCVGI
jgi:hypothetical protein